MARSIDDWFKDHANGSLGDSLDDEVVEAQAPWDVHASGMATTRSQRKDGTSSRRTGGGQARGGQSSTGARSDAQSRNGQAATQKNSRRKRTVTGRTPSLEMVIRRAAAQHRDVGYKRLARILRDKGHNVTKQQVAEVLAHPKSSWGRATRIPSPRKPAMVFRVSAGAQKSRAVPITELCPSCGVRTSITAACRCS